VSKLGLDAYGGGASLPRRPPSGYNNEEGGGGGDGGGGVSGGPLRRRGPLRGSGRSHYLEANAGMSVPSVAAVGGSSGSYSMLYVAMGETFNEKISYIFSVLL